MTPSLMWTVEEDRISLSGRIDENTDLGPLALAIPAAGTIIDLGGLSRINSIGVREWMDFIAALGERPMRLERCSPVFVEQLNAIANFAGAAEIGSILSAYECESDGDTTLVEIMTSDVRAGTLPACPRCPRCASEMIPAQEHELYFRFLRYTR